MSWSTRSVASGSCSCRPQRTPRGGCLRWTTSGLDQGTGRSNISIPRCRSAGRSSPAACAFASRGLSGSPARARSSSLPPAFPTWLESRRRACPSAYPDAPGAALGDVCRAAVRARPRRSHRRARDARPGADGRVAAGLPTRARPGASERALSSLIAVHLAGATMPCATDVADREMADRPAPPGAQGARSL